MANLDPVIGSEQGHIRPVLVISEETVNKVLPVLNVLPITSRKPMRTVYPNEVLLPEGANGLEMESIVLCHQIRTQDKQRLVRRLGIIKSPKIRAAVLERRCDFNWAFPSRESES